MPEQSANRGEPWMRGTHPELDPLRRAVIHALEQGEEDAERWCSHLSKDALFARPGDLPSAAFHMRHIVRSLDRLLTYAQDQQLDSMQTAALQTEALEGSAAEVQGEFRAGMASAMERVRSMSPETYEAARGIGRKRLPTTVAGLLIHCAEHTQRHIGQMITTAKLVGSGHAESS